jgi:mono/diheme cytochrome c family protein
MKMQRVAAALIGGVMIAASGFAISAGPAKKMDFGKREYDANCAGCHGAKGKGDGPYKPYLTKSPPDLTVLTKNNKGVFPYERVSAVIDGRQSVPGHGTQDMPIWGADYLAKSAGDYMDVPYDPEIYVRTRILALIDYLERLQAK